MIYSLFIDPGKSGCGFALFCEDSLVDAGWAEPDIPDDPGSKQALAVARSVLQRLDATHIDVLCHERMADQGRAYATSGILDLATTCGVLVGLLAPADPVIHCPKPSEWKGSVPKEVIWQRAQALMDEGTQAHAQDCLERGPRRRLADIKDAIALGMWFHNGKTWGRR